ncbi:hypothetical protein Y032_0509g2727 [Ancylostoma ceylanicum]|nr:hypothetical protein Y032_0509g2727 [Ancylostoma ceylanicum]
MLDDKLKQSFKKPRYQATSSAIQRFAVVVKEMRSFEAVLLALLVVALFATSGNSEKCGPNEVYDRCASDSCYSTCKEQLMSKCRH